MYLPDELRKLEDELLCDYPDHPDKDVFLAMISRAIMDIETGEASYAVKDGEIVRIPTFR